jgi:hypothetical protein
VLARIDTYFMFSTHVLCGPGSSVGIATDYGLDGPGIESPWGEIFLLQTGPWAHPASCTMGTGCFPGVKNGRGLLLTTHPLLVPRSWKSRAIPLPTLWDTPRPVTEALYLYNIKNSLLQATYIRVKWYQDASRAEEVQTLRERTIVLR